jgi:hypothetical protein
MVAAWALLMTLAVHTAEGSEPPKEQAQALLDDGLALYARHEYAAALTKFNQALSVYPSPKLWFNIAQAERDLNHPVQALTAFEKFLATADGPAAALADAREAVGELRERLGRLRLRSGDGGLEVSLDGRIAGRTPFVSDIWVLPGSHVLVVGSGNTSASTTVTVAAGDSETVELPRVAPETSATREAAPLLASGPVAPASPANGARTEFAAPRPSAQADSSVRRGWWLGRTWTWVAAGAAVASAGGALTFGLLMQSKYDDLNRSCGSLSTSRTGCSPSDFASLDRRKTAANALWIAAGASALTASILFAVESRPVTLGPVAGQPGLLVHGKF